MSFISSSPTRFLPEFLRLKEKGLFQGRSLGSVIVRNQQQREAEAASTNKNNEENHQLRRKTKSVAATSSRTNRNKKHKIGSSPGYCGAPYVSWGSARTLLRKWSFVPGPNPVSTEYELYYRVVIPPAWY